MATYAYECGNGHYVEESRSIHEGPKPGLCDKCGGRQRQVFFSSLLVFGNFVIGDDDFSRRYHLNGEAGKYGGKANRTQGQTNVNAVLRKYGVNGRPLELNPDIDPTKPWDSSKGTPPGVDPNTEAPLELQSSQARGDSLKEHVANN